MEKAQEETFVNIMHVCYFIVKTEQPFTLFPGLLSLGQRVGANIPTGYSSDKACARFTVDVYEMERAKVLKALQETRVMSVLIDGATDSANLEQEIVYVRVLTNDGPKNMFLSIEDVKHASAAGVLDALISALNDADIEWEQKVVAFGSDGAAVNLGKKNGVAAKLCQTIPYLIAIHCIAHRLELGSVDAVKQNRQMAVLQETLTLLYDQYHYSPKALRELRMIAEALEEKVLKPTTLRGARWLPYVHRATKIVCHSYGPIVAHFEDITSTERSPKPSATVAGRAHKVLKFLKKYENVLFMHFLCDALDHLKELSLQFQRDDMTVSKAIACLEACYLNLTSLKTDMGPLMQSFVQYIAQSGKYKGIQLSGSTVGFNDVKKTIIDSIIDHWDARLMELQVDSTVALFRVFDPSIWPLVDHSHFAASRESLAAFGQEEVRALGTAFEVLLARHDVTVADLLSEYNTYKSYARLRASLPMNDIFMAILNSGQAKEMRGLALLFEVYLVLPVSTAVCERGFSTLKRIKTDWRSSLGSRQLQRLMFLAIEVPPVEEFNAKAAVHHWWNSGPRVRRPGFNPNARRQAAETQEQILDVIESELAEIVQEDAVAEKAAASYID